MALLTRVRKTWRKSSESIANSMLSLGFAKRIGTSRDVSINALSRMMSAINRSNLAVIGSTTRPPISQRDHSLAASVNFLQITRLLLGQRPHITRKEHLGVPIDRGQRRPELVGSQ